MTSLTIYLSSCALLLLTLSARSTWGLPVRALSAEKCRDCSSGFRSFLTDISDLLTNPVLCFGIPSEEILVSSGSNTALACTPNLAQSPGCMMQRNSTFSEGECLSNIMKDLSHYSAVIRSYLATPLINPGQVTKLLDSILENIQSLRRSCSLMPDEEDDSSQAVTLPWKNNSFENRQEMCKMMRGLHTRTITINRALGYIASGDHRK